MNRDYRVLARLGEGGMAIVYLALIGGAEGFRKLVAIKVLREQQGVDRDELHKMFAHEARVSARCHHRNVVQILDVSELEGRPALCMEYLDGVTYRQLKGRAARSDRLPLFEQLRILAEAAHGLHHVHTLTDYDGQPLGLVHCDVSPENIFVTYDGQVKLLDFGIAQAHGDLPRAPGFRGKLSYLAPELITGDRVDARADVFALGALLWEAVSVAPFSGGPGVDSATKLRARVAGSERNIRSVQPDVSEALANIIDRAVALDPQARFPDAESFACALEEYLHWAGAQPSAQSLSRIVGPLFEREREKLRAIIDPQLQLADRLELAGPRAASEQGELGRPAAAADSGFGFPVRTPPSSSAYAFAGPADTVSPDAPVPVRGKRFAPLLLVATLGVLGGALAGFWLARRAPEQATAAVGTRPAEPAGTTGSAAPAAIAAAPAPLNAPGAAADIAVGAQPATSSADSSVRVDHDDAAGSSLASAPCVTTARALGDEMRRLATEIVQSEDRRARHLARRLRRRAAQCAAGRTEKCDPPS